MAESEKNHERNAGFTLAEVLIAIAVGTIVLATAATMFVSTFKMWRDISSDIYMIGQARLIRERLLRGPDGVHGMREIDDDILIPSADGQFRIFYNAVDSADNAQRCSVRGNPIPKRSIWWHDNGTWTRINRPAVHSGIKFIGYDENERILTCIVSNLYPVGTRTNKFLQTLRIPVLNEEE